MLYELILGWSSRQNKKFYKKLFNPKVYYLALFGSVLLLIKPLLDLYLLKQFTLIALYIPFFYLLLFKIINWFSLRINKRNIIILAKGDEMPKEYKWYVDSLLLFVALFLSVLIPIFISMFYEGKLP